MRKILSYFTFAVCLGLAANHSLLGQTSPFVSADVGAPAKAGSVVNNGNGSYTIVGGGVDIYGTADGFHYYYTSVTGITWEAKMQVISLAGPDAWSKVGLMVRKPSEVGGALTAGDANIMAVGTRVGGTPAGRNSLGTQHRATAGATTADHQPAPDILPNYPNTWLRITRTNHLYTLTYSTNGTTFNTFAGMDPSFSVYDVSGTANGFDGTNWANPILVGVAVTAHADADPNGATAVVSNLSVTVYPVIAPTVAGQIAAIQGKTTVYANAETTFSFRATNNSQPQIAFPMEYVWLKNGTPVSTNSGTNFTFLTTTADNGAQISCTARVANPAYYNVSVTSAALALTTLPGAQVYTNGLKRHFYAGGNRGNIENGNVLPGVVSLVPSADLPVALGVNYGLRLSGYFIAPSSGSYTFFLNSNDDADLFFNPNGSDPAGKALIAKQVGASNPYQWAQQTDIDLQRRSDLFSPDGGQTYPWFGTINLVAGNRYYIEAVHSQIGGNANLGITYKLDSDPDPALGSLPLLHVTNNNIASITWPGTNITWVLQPTPKVVFEGDTAIFTGSATTDAEMLPIYQWYINDAPVTNATTSTLTLPLVQLAQNGSQIKLVASRAAGSQSITSSPVTLTVQQAVLETGFAKVERWDGALRQQINAGTLGAPGYVAAVPGFEVSVDNPGNQANFARRVTTLFIPQTSGNYVFFINGDDDTDLFVSTDYTAANKRLVCQEAGWSNPRNWLTPGGGSASVASQKRSDTWTPDGGATIPWSAGIPLVAGTKYYIEMAFHQGAGGANCSATYKLVGDPDPANGTASKLIGERIVLNAPPINYVAFTQHPSNATVAPFGYLALSVNGITDSTIAVGSILGNENTYTNNFLMYRWYKNNVLIPGATARTLTYGPVVPGDNGTQFRCEIRALGYADIAYNPIWSNSATATLTVQQGVFESGAALVNIWTDAANNSRLAIEAGTAGAPNNTYATQPGFESPVVPSGGNRGYRMSGYFTPPQSGNYVFYLNSNDDADLFLSTDASSANARLIARENVAGTGLWNWQDVGGTSVVGDRRSDTFTDPVTQTQPFTAGIPLTAGQRYYISVVHRNAAGGEFNSVNYKLIADPDPEIVPRTGTRIRDNQVGFYTARVPWVGFLQHPAGQNVTSGGSATFAVRGTNAPALILNDYGDPRPQITGNTNFFRYQWKKNGVDIPGATSRTYTLSPVLPSDHNAQFVCAIRTLGYSDDSFIPAWSNSAPATLTVTTDTAPPTIAHVSTFVNTNQVPSHYVLNITFNKIMNAASLNAATYTVPGATVTGVSVANGGRTVHLLLSGPPTLPASVTVTGANDVSGNALVANSATINAEKLTFSDIGTVGVDPAFPSFVTNSGLGGYIVSAQGSDIFNNADGFNFGWELKTGDFDVVVRGVSITKTDNFAKMGLMVREDLTPGSRNWSIANNPTSADGIQAVNVSGLGANSVEANTRRTNSLATVSWRSGAAGTTVPAYPSAWLRLKRAGNNLLAYWSPNGTNWGILGTFDTTTTNNPGPLPATMYVGIATTAHVNDTFGPPFYFYNTAQFADYNSSYVPPQAALTVTRSNGTNVIVGWVPTGGGSRLERSGEVGAGASWLTVGTNNPTTLLIWSTNQYFRVVGP